MYTTIKGSQVEFTSELLAGGIKRLAYKRFDGSDDLFDACWDRYVEALDGGIDDPDSIDDVMEWLEAFAAEEVNDPSSDYYMYG